MNLAGPLQLRVIYVVLFESVTVLDLIRGRRPMLIGSGITGKICYKL